MRDSRIGNEENEGERPSPVLAEDVSLLLLVKAIGTALRILITVDEAVAKNDDLREAWGMFKDVAMDHSEENSAVSSLLCFMDSNIPSLTRTHILNCIQIYSTI